MNVLHFVSKEDNVICVIQVSEVVVAQLHRYIFSLLSTSKHKTLMSAEYNQTLYGNKQRIQ